MEHTEKEREEEEEDPREENTVSWGRKEKDSEKVDGGGATNTRKERREREREREKSYLFCALSAPAPLLTGKACARICFSGTLLPRKKRARKMQGKAREEEASPSDVPTLSWVVRSVLLWTTRKVPIIHTEAGEVSQWSLPTLFSHTRRRGPSPITVIIARINLSLVLLRPKNRGALFSFLFGYQNRFRNNKERSGR